MNFGYVKVGAYSPEIKVADVDFNTNSILNAIEESIKSGVKLLVFPSLCISGSTCGDLFFQDKLILDCKNALKKIAEQTVGKNIIVCVGLPLMHSGRLYNAVATIFDGKVLGLTAKKYFGNIESGDYRYFSSLEKDEDVQLFSYSVPFSSKIVYKNSLLENFAFECCIDKDVYLESPSSLTRIIVNPYSDYEGVSRAESRRNILSSVSTINSVCIVSAGAGLGESTTDQVYSGHNLIIENGNIKNQSQLFTSGLITFDIDTSLLAFKSAKKEKGETKDAKKVVYFPLEEDNSNFNRVYDKSPFIPKEQKVLIERIDLIRNLQKNALAKRINHTFAKKIVLGLSGGLDSTLAILVCVDTIKHLNRPLKDIIAVTMPCFGTSSRTYQNTIKLAKALGVTLKKIDISKSVIRHLKDIKHKDGVYDATYENAQARERTQVLMDYANKEGGIVVGTGDLSELALGWATYNGDHMSSYGVNGSITKTMIRKIVEVWANEIKGKTKAVLLDILDTPISPELLPPNGEDIAHKTEELVGPYILHDFFLYHIISNGYLPEKIFYIACKAFEGEFSKETILKWFKTFIRRFFSQQFKRSCLPDGVRVGSVAISPRGGLSMPSDASSKIWIDSLDKIKL